MSAIPCTDVDELDATDPAPSHLEDAPPLRLHELHETIEHALTDPQSRVYRSDGDEYTMAYVEMYIERKMDAELDERLLARPLVGAMVKGGR